MSKSLPKPKTVPIPTPESAAGLPSIRSVAYRIWEETYIGRGVKTLFKLNQPKGFDCPSCAWPDPDPDEVSSVAEYCENGAKAVAWEITKNHVDRRFFQQNSVLALLEKDDHWLEKQGRITEPLILKPGSSHYEAISWEAAFNEISNHLKALDSPDQSIWYTSGRTSNEAAFIYQTFVRMLGTNNLPDCSNMCHEASGVALKQTLGIGKASVTLSDIQQAEVLMVMGQNPGTNAPRMLTELQKLKKSGGKIIAVNPLPEAGLMAFRHPQKPWEWVGSPTSLQDLFLPVQINGDQAFLLAIQKLLWEEEQKHPGTVFDHAFIRSYTKGYDALIAHLDSLSLDELIRASGLKEAEIREAASLMMHSRRIIIAWAMGITQQRNAESTIREIVNLLLLKGAMGKPGAGTLPVRGHSNVQGDRTMGIWEKMPEPFLEKLGDAFSFVPPRKEGFGTIQAIEAMEKGKARVFFGLGGNFALATPDTEQVFEALRGCDLTVHVSTKLNRSHLIHGKTALILPCLGRTEEDLTPNGRQFVTTEDTAGRVRMSMGDLPPASGELRSEVAIICGLARVVLGTDHATPWEDLAGNYDLIREKIEAVIPGFEQYNKRVREPGGFYLPNGARERKFQTADGKAVFTVNPISPPQVAPGNYVLMTLRSHDQFNTTIYGLDDRYRGVRDSRQVVLMNPVDMERKHLRQGDKTRITSFFQGQERVLSGFAALPYELPEGSAAMYFPEGNVLVALDSHSPESHCPASKFIEVSIEKLHL
ncbi:Putative formate dehydrogenase oxidoreductase protein [Lunatimonas lonarensis]|uniref:Putative formate dehydrogenase oxidoreductase protein n=1 Tax=Lunatimonas lonarensis TaxID=1232681 RepID=R7ZW15_9BACT|nr:FdhF/YdeP family oxidoreductase [Lunatimonas lonarensis]EON78336.1 Putative formate dehydrogenase oxidoreductase protein [Lunatimonas lonarensis]